jgi:hypothetical protein
MAVDDTLFCLVLLYVTVLSFFVIKANQYILLVRLWFLLDGSGRYGLDENKTSREQGHI